MGDLLWRRAASFIVRKSLIRSASSMMGGRCRHHYVLGGPTVLLVLAAAAASLAVAAAADGSGGASVQPAVPFLSVVQHIVTKHGGHMKHSHHKKLHRGLRGRKAGSSELIVKHLRPAYRPAAPGPAPALTPSPAPYTLFAEEEVVEGWDQGLTAEGPATEGEPTQLAAAEDTAADEDHADDAVVQVPKHTTLALRHHKNQHKSGSRTAGKKGGKYHHKKDNKGTGAGTGRSTSSSNVGAGPEPNQEGSNNSGTTYIQDGAAAEAMEADSNTEDDSNMDGVSTADDAGAAINDATAGTDAWVRATRAGLEPQHIQSPPDFDAAMASFRQQGGAGLVSLASAAAVLNVGTQSAVAGAMAPSTSTAALAGLVGVRDLVISLAARPGLLQALQDRQVDRLAALLTSDDVDAIVGLPGLTGVPSVHKAGTGAAAQLTTKKLAAATAMVVLRHMTAQQAGQLAALLIPAHVHPAASFDQLSAQLYEARAVAARLEGIADAITIQAGPAAGQASTSMGDVELLVGGCAPARPAAAREPKLAGLLMVGLLMQARVLVCGG